MNVYLSRGLELLIRLPLLLIHPIRREGGRGHANIHDRTEVRGQTQRCSAAVGGGWRVVGGGTRVMGGGARVVGGGARVVSSTHAHTNSRTPNTPHAHPPMHEVAPPQNDVTPFDVDPFPLKSKLLLHSSQLFLCHGKVVVRTTPFRWWARTWCGVWGWRVGGLVSWWGDGLVRDGALARW